MATATLNHLTNPLVQIGLTTQERKDLERFVKFLTQKMVQVIIQSRLGEKISTPCKASSSDWFNLGIEDISEVVVETKKALKGQILSVGSPPLCVEISLKTVEGDSLILEVWTLSVAGGTENLSRLTYTVYSRMSLLLKSVIAVSRVTPAYKLSARQGADSFVVCYRVYIGEPLNLGKTANTCFIGQVETPIGIYSVGVSYRTQLTISPRDEAMMVKSDHFTPEYSPKLCRADRKQGESSGSEQVATSDESQDACRLFVNSPPNSKPEYPRHSFDEGPKYGAFADPSNRRLSSADFALPELPLPTFMRTISKDAKKEDCAQQKLKQSQEESMTTANADSRRSSISLGPNSCEDFVMVDSLKTPFTEGDSGNDAGALFRECQSAPPSLASFRAIQPIEIGDQLEQFEKDLKRYDDLVQSLCIGEESSKS